MRLGAALLWLALGASSASAQAAAAAAPGAPVVPAGAAGPASAVTPGGAVTPREAVTVGAQGTSAAGATSGGAVTAGAGDARRALEHALDFLVRTQNGDGGFGTPTVEGLWDSEYSLESYYAWQYAGVALAAYALMLSPETPARRASLERALNWLVTTRFPKRPSDWDNDTMWSSVYGLVATVHAAEDPRFQAAEWTSRLAARGRECASFLVASQAPEGGWGYYDDPPFTRRPKWATSFSTAAVLPALLRAQALGWLPSAPEANEAGARARSYVRRCALPNGAYAYDLRPLPRVDGGEGIDDVKGSLGRIQVCNWALAQAGERSITSDRIAEGLALFLEHHKFLDAARMRPIPHEAYYANAGYFYYFGHLYAAEAIQLLPLEQRESFHARLRMHVIKTQRTDGSFCDYQWQSYNVAACTGMAAATLALGLPEASRKSP